MTTKYQVISRSPVIMYVDPRIITERRMDADYYKPEFLENQEQLENSGQSVTVLKHLWYEGKYGTLPSSSDYADEGVTLIRGGDFRDLGVIADESLVRVPISYWENSPKARTESGEVLLLAKGATIDGPNSVALCPARFDKALVNGSVFRIKTKPIVDAAYLAAYMATPALLLQKQRAISNTGIFYNDLESIENFLVPLPPRPVQEYIGAKVRLAERCRARARELRVGATNALKNAFGKVPEIHTGKSIAWVDSRDVFDRIDPDYFNQRYLTLENQVRGLTGSSLVLGQVCDVFSGTSAPEQETESPQRVVKVGNLSEDGVDWDNTGYLRVDRKVKSRFVLREGDVMFCCAAHHHSYIGKKVTLALVGSIRAIPTPEVMVCRLRGDQLLPGYLAEFLRSPWGYWQIQRTVKGITAHAYSDDVMRIVVPIIPLETQKQIDRALREASQFITKARKLVHEAKTDVEALIEGRLDVEGIVAGRVRPPTWEDIEV